MNLLIGIGFVIAFTIMVVWPTMDEWFKDLEEGDCNWTEKW